MSYASNALTAKRLLTKYGQALTITHYDTSDTYDPATGVAESIPSTQSGVGYIKTNISNKKETLAQKTDNVLLLSAVDINEPNLTDIININSVDYVINSIRPIFKADIVVAYECDLVGA